MNKEHEYIKYKHFLKALTCQRFFIWNDLEEIKNNDFSKEDNLENFWEEVQMEEVQTSASEIVALTFSKFNSFLMELLTKDKNNYVIVKGKTIEEKMQSTKELLKLDKILIGPIFEYQNCVSSPFAFYNKNKIIINIKYSTKTKRRDFLKAFYDYSIICQSTNVDDYHLYLPRVKDYKKNEIDLFPTNKLHFQKSGDVPGALNKNWEEKNIKVIETLKGNLANNKTKTKQNIFFPNFQSVIKRIEDAKKVTKPNFEELSYDNTNSKWNELLEYLNNDFAWANGKIISKKSIIEENEPIDSTAWNAITKHKNAYIPDEQKEKVEKIINEIKNVKEVVWYDFEGFSLPYAPLDNVLPFHQIVFQVSKIITFQNKEIHKENIVIDPQKITLDDLYMIIESVYSGQKDKYVVYNKTYENTRLKEMVKLLDESNHPETKKAEEMVDFIVENTIDLYELFVLNSKNKKPLVVLHDQKGRTSIKNVEKHISQNNILLPRLIIPYANLEVSNGLMAMEIAIKRSLNLIGQQEWTKKEEKLKKYCENDVKAMIMVYDFVNYILDSEKIF